MRWSVAMIFSIFWLSAIAQETSLEVLGVTVSKGMTQGEVRALFPADAIYPVPKAESAPEEIDIWVISQRGERGGSIRFDNRRVSRVTRRWVESDDTEVYRLFVLLYEILARLTEGGDYTCAMIMAYAPQDFFPQSSTVLVLPDRIVEIGTGSRTGGETGSVSIEESLRMNPVPATAKVHKGLGDTDHCVFPE